MPRPSRSMDSKRVTTPRSGPIPPSLRFPRNGWIEDMVCHPSAVVLAVTALTTVARRILSFYLSLPILCSVYRTWAFCRTMHESLIFTFIDPLRSSMGDWWESGPCPDSTAILNMGLWQNEALVDTHYRHRCVSFCYALFRTWFLLFFFVVSSVWLLLCGGTRGMVRRMLLVRSLILPCSFDKFSVYVLRDWISTVAFEWNIYDLRTLFLFVENFTVVLARGLARNPPTNLVTHAIHYHAVQINQTLS